MWMLKAFTAVSMSETETFVFILAYYILCVRCQPNCSLWLINSNIHAIK
jgi:hypothetical protein